MAREQIKCTRFSHDELLEYVLGDAQYPIGPFETAFWTAQVDDAWQRVSGLAWL